MSEGLTPAERADVEESIEGLCSHSRWKVTEYEGGKRVRECCGCGRIELPMPHGWAGLEVIRTLTDEELEAAARAPVCAHKTDCAGG